MSEVLYPDQLNDEARTLDDYIFDYFNGAYGDEVEAVIYQWKKKFPDKPPTPPTERGGEDEK